MRMTIRIKRANNQHPLPINGFPIYWPAGSATRCCWPQQNWHCAIPNAIYPLYSISAATGKDPDAVGQSVIKSLQSKHAKGEFANLTQEEKTALYGGDEKWDAEWQAVYPAADCIPRKQTNCFSELLVDIRDTPFAYAPYIGRAHDLAGIYSLVALQLELKMIAKQDWPAAIKSSHHKNPYTKKPFDYDAATQSLGFSCFSAADICQIQL